MSNIDKIESRYRDVKQLVRELTGLSEEHHNNYFFNLGSDWCDANTPNEEMATALATHPRFWAWWSSVWLDAEEAFIGQVSYSLDEGCHAIIKKHPERGILIIKGDALRRFYLVWMAEMTKYVRTNSVVISGIVPLKPVFNNY